MMDIKILLLMSIISLHAAENAMQDTFIYCHGFGSSGDKVKRYMDLNILPQDTISFHFQDARLHIEPVRGFGMGFNLWDSCIGQKDDVERLERVVQAQTKRVVLFGESRGAATILNYLGNPFCPVDTIKAVVLDSPFDTLPNVIQHRLRGWYLDRIIAPSTAESLLSHCTNYKSDGLQPLNAVSKIALKDRHIPILFIASKEDKFVPPASSLRLYAGLREQGHDEAHVLLLDHGTHGWIIEGADAHKYRNAVHAFYRTKGILHTAEYSQAGYETFKICQPDAGAIDALLKELD